MEDPKDQQLHIKILDKIKSGQVTQHSRAYLVWRTVLLVLALALLLAAGIFVVSFVVFSLRMSGVWDLPQFGTHGLAEFLLFFPWLFIPAVLLFLWLLERFILRHSPAYRLPVLYSVGAVLVIILGASLLVLATPLHHRLYVSAEHQHLPVAGSMYRFFGQDRPDDLYIGTVASSTGHMYLLQTPDNDNITIITNNDTHWMNHNQLQPGDCVEVVGEEQGNQVIATFIRQPNSTFASPCENVSPPMNNMNIPYMIIRKSP